MGKKEWEARTIDAGRENRMDEEGRSPLSVRSASKASEGVLLVLVD